MAKTELEVRYRHRARPFRDWRIGIYDYAGEHRVVIHRQESDGIHLECIRCGDRAWAILQAALVSFWLEQHGWEREASDDDTQR